MQSKDELMAVINRDIPQGVNWKEGARTYVASCFEKEGRGRVEAYSLNKPFREVGVTDPQPAIEETVHYLRAFSNVLELLMPRHGARILDVACGAGWVSNYLSKMGYWTYGIDISEDFIDIARRRLSSDPTLGVSEQAAHARFAVVDIERDQLAPELRGSFDIIWLESCLHHFYDPIQALSNLQEALRPEGLLVLIEFENRSGAIKPENMRIMKEYDTLERSFSRTDLVSALQLSGFPNFEFLGSINGWFHPEDERTVRLGNHARESADSLNLAICAKSPAPLTTLFPYRRAQGKVSLGSGFYLDEGGFAWSGPQSEIAVHEDMDELILEFQGILAQTDFESQTLIAYRDRGMAGRIDFTHSKGTGRLGLKDLRAGETIRLISPEAFCPAWTGGNDPRILSFYLITSGLDAGVGV